MAKKKAKRKTTRQRKPLDVTLPIYRINIALRDIQPLIWRRIETSDCTLADLHELIQMCFDWEDDHAHVFSVGDLEYSGAYEQFPDNVEDTEGVFLSDLAGQGHVAFDYEYDFGDSWIHEITIEATLPAEPGISYPRCIEGQRKAPPEDSGGPYAYPRYLASLAGDVEAEAEDLAEFLRDDFDPEQFDLELLNQRLRQSRGLLGLDRSAHIPAAAFDVGDLVRGKPGIVHPAYPDLPLSGWTGTVEEIAWLVPIGYGVCWTDATLDSVHPVYFKRCSRDRRDPHYGLLEEPQIEAAQDDDPVQIEQPAAIQTVPLSPDSVEDRIRMIFGLTSDDPLPRLTPETNRIYHAYLSANLEFPMSAVAMIDDDRPPQNVVVVGLADVEEANDSGLCCKLQAGQPVETVKLTSLLLDDEERNCRLIEDYRYWIFDVQHMYEDAAEEDQNAADALEDEEFDDEDDEDEDGNGFYAEEGKGDFDDTDDDWDDEDWDDEIDEDDDDPIWRA
jgi:hypothetical protein